MFSSRFAAFLGILSLSLAVQIGPLATANPFGNPNYNSYKDVTWPAFGATPRLESEPRDYPLQELNTRAINKAIYDCHNEGGGIVHVKKKGNRGIYDISQIRMLSKVTLKVDEGVTLLASNWWRDYRSLPPDDVNITDPNVTADPDTWPQLNNLAPTAFDFSYAVINATGCYDIAVIGTGTIDGNRSRVPADADLNGFQTWQAIRAEATGFAEGWDDDDYVGDPGQRRGVHLIRFIDCTNVKIGNLDGNTSPNSGAARLNFVDSGNYTLYLNESKVVDIRNVNIFGGWDGIHARFGETFAVVNLHIVNNMDDGIAGHNCFNWYAENVTIDGGYFAEDSEDISPALPEKVADAAAGISQGNGWRFGCVLFYARDVEVRDKEQAGIHYFADAEYERPADNDYNLGSNGFASTDWTLKDWTIQDCDFAFYYHWDGLWQDAGPLGSVTLENFNGWFIREQPIIWDNEFGPKKGDLTLKNCTMLISFVKPSIGVGYGMFARSINSLRLEGQNYWNYFWFQDTNNFPPPNPVEVVDNTVSFGNQPYSGQIYFQGY